MGRFITFAQRVERPTRAGPDEIARTLMITVNIKFNKTIRETKDTKPERKYLEGLFVLFFLLCRRVDQRQRDDDAGTSRLLSHKVGDDLAANFGLRNASGSTSGMHVRSQVDLRCTKPPTALPRPSHNSQKVRYYYNINNTDKRQQNRHDIADTLRRSQREHKNVVRGRLAKRKHHGCTCRMLLARGLTKNN